MKKLALLVLGILLGFLICYFFFCATDSVTTAEEPVPPKGLIDKDAIIALDTTYNARYDAVSRFIGREDNRSSWYSLSDVRNYLDYAENEATELGYTLGGVRIYLGAHKPEDGQNAGLTTMFFVPTGTRNNSKGSLFNLNLLPPGDDDIPGGSGMNYGNEGEPPGANYPQ